MIIAEHKEYWPSFGITEDQKPMCVYTVLCLGGRGDDCAAYRGIGPDISNNESARADLLDRIKRGGQKIRKSEASEIFDLRHNGVDLEYRR
ncbi:MAG TPA: hypothetical protein VMV33_00235 [Rhodocyclaceae bacterium]|nr:hypothetical protein [Rhodocyclaceae bacterium]